jgi:tetratricopeptide (TPR) repeat protein
MLSSTYKELAEHREAVRKAMLGQRLIPVAMEDDAVLPDKDLISASLSKVDESDAYVGLIGYRYGQAPHDSDRNPDGLSLTELEFRRAVERKVPICMFIMHNDHPVTRRAVGEERGSEEKYDAFVKLAKKDRIYAEFKSVDDLKAKAVQSLVELRRVLEPSATQSKIDRPQPSHYAISNVPINVPLHFLGRDEDLGAVDGALKRNQGRVAITALHGLRGVGKSTLAAAYAHRRREDYRATWWIRAETESTMRADLVSLGVRLGWVVADAAEEVAINATVAKLGEDGSGVLLIYDNANNSREIQKYLPRGGAARILVTSTAPDWRGVATQVDIEVWPDAVGADYLVERSGRADERNAALALSKTLGGLPLAHEQAAAFCERIGISLAEYLKRFEANPAKLPGTEQDAPHDYGRTVATTFALAIEAAAKLHPAAEPLIVHAALLAPEPIPLFLFSEAIEAFDEPMASALSGDGLDEAVGALLAFALVDRESIPDERDPTIVTDSIRLHRLVRQVAAARCTGGEREDATRRLIATLARTLPDRVYDDPQAWRRMHRLDPLALALVGGVASLPEGAERSGAALLNSLGAYRQIALAAYSSARPLFERALAINEKALGPDHPDTATSMNNLGYLLWAQGDQAGARPYYERALAIRERVLPRDHPDMATSLNNFAHLLQARGDLAGARPYYEGALAINEKAFGPDHPDTATSLNNLGHLLSAQGDVAEARLYYERALSIREKALSSDHPDTATSVNNLGYLLQVSGDLEEARPYYERALAIREKALGSDHPDTATSLNNLGYLLQEQGDVTGARRYYERALAINQKAQGPDHPDTARGLNNLGALLDSQGDLAGARPYYERALAIREKALGPDHPDTATSLNNLAYLLQAQGDPAEARPRFERALDIFEKSLGVSHPSTQIVAANTAFLLDQLKSKKQAAALRKKFGLPK